MSDDRAAVRYGAMFRRERPPEQLTGFAREAEALGLDEIWIVEDCFWAGGLTAVSAALGATERVHVGMGIVPAVARNAAITAMELSGIARMFPGRFVAGFGHGVAAWMRQIGALPTSQLAALEETIDAVRRLLDGESITVSGRHVALDDVRLVFPPAQRPPIVVGVTGPKGIDLAGRVAEGLLLPEGSSAPYVGAALARFGRPAACVVYVLFAIDDDPEVARSMVASSVEEFAPGDRDERLAKLGIDEAVVAGERVDRYAVAGTPADCARAVDALVASGATSVVVVPRADDPSAQDAQIARFVREVVPLVGAR
ncbi:MAG: LLM class flavin-dependent oxidoreductase [Acidimicrobiales bacterium]|nr:LLM class flavin-dependent oxidoreductase [Acidimicrobiales bacterium]